MSKPISAIGLKMNPYCFSIAVSSNNYLQHVHITPLPFTKPICPGLVLHAGQIIPVFDLRAWIEGDDRQNLTNLVTVRLGNDECALCVDEPPQLLDNLKIVATAQTAIPAALHPFVDNTLHDDDDQRWWHLNFDVIHHLKNLVSDDPFGEVV